MSRLLLIAFFLEVGFALIVVPWSTFWDQNYFAQSIPFIGAIITNNYVRGAITGIGIVNVIAGLAELASLFMARNQDMDMPVPPLRDE